MNVISARGAAALALLALACRSGPSDADLVKMGENAARLGPKPVAAKHAGPPVAPGTSGTSSYAKPVYVAFDETRALATTAFADRFWREPANDGFNAVLAYVEEGLREAGYGSVEGLELETWDGAEPIESWTPLSAKLALRTRAAETVLHRFAQPDDVDRLLAPKGQASTSVEGRLVAMLEHVEPGTALLLDGAFDAGVLAQAAERGAVLAIAADLAKYNVDPGKEKRHEDAIGYRSKPRDAAIACAQVSPKSMKRLREALGADREARVAFECVSKVEMRPLRTLVATLVGASAPLECVPIVAHVQEPGACDNASGVATCAEAARVLASLVRNGEIARPARSVCFVFGDEMEQSRVFLERSKRRAIAAIAADMTGESREKTGAIALLERAPDPGALQPLAPDEHTAWGASKVDEGELQGGALSVIARCALVDAGLVAQDWKTNEHPFEGGSDHVVFLRAGVPAVLFWHFPDFAYHTSLDRLEHVDASEMRRSGAAILACALAVAHAGPDDLERWLWTARHELDVRLKACEKAGADDLAQRWIEWNKRVRMELRALCFEKEGER